MILLDAVVLTLRVSAYSAIYDYAKERTWLSWKTCLDGCHSCSIRSCPRTLCSDDDILFEGSRKGPNWALERRPWSCESVGESTYVEVALSDPLICKYSKHGYRCWYGAMRRQGFHLNMIVTTCDSFTHPSNSESSLGQDRQDRTKTRHTRKESDTRKKRVKRAYSYQSRVLHKWAR